jgi:hypothetical protein
VQQKIEQHGRIVITDHGEPASEFLIPPHKLVCQQIGDETVLTGHLVSSHGLARRRSSSVGQERAHADSAGSGNLSLLTSRL